MLKNGNILIWLLFLQQECSRYTGFEA